MLQYLIHTASACYIGIVNTLPIANNTHNIMSHLMKYNDTGNILHLLRTPGDIDIKNSAYLSSLLEQYEVPLFRYNEFISTIMDNMGYLSTDTAKLLRICYNHTLDINIIKRINNCGLHHLFGTPLTSITIEDFVLAITQSHRTVECVFLFTHMNEDQRLLICSHLDLEAFFTCVELLRLVLPYYDKTADDHIIAYALVHNAIYDITEEELSPAEYIVARKYSNWSGKLHIRHRYQTSVVINNLVTRDDIELVSYVISQIKLVGHNTTVLESYMNDIMM